MRPVGQAGVAAADPRETQPGQVIRLTAGNLRAPHHQGAFTTPEGHPPRRATQQAVAAALDFLALACPAAHTGTVLAKRPGTAESRFRRLRCVPWPRLHPLHQAWIALRIAEIAGECGEFHCPVAPRRCDVTLARSSISNNSSTTIARQAAGNAPSRIKR